MTLFEAIFAPRHDDHGKARTAGLPIRRLPFPERVTVPLAQHIGKPARTCVRIGQPVARGELIAEADGFVSIPHHAPVSGTVEALPLLTMADGRRTPAIAIRTDPSSLQCRLPLPPAVDPLTLTPDALAFMADRVEGNLLAARQEIDKLALLHPPGELDLDALRAAVANVARFDVFKLSESWLAGDVARVTRMLAGLKAEGEAPVLALWSVAEELRGLIRLRVGLKDGKPLAALMKENRIWGERQRLVEPALRRLSQARLQTALGQCADIDRAIKGAGDGDPWDKLEHLLLALSRTP